MKPKSEIKLVLVCESYGHGTIPCEGEVRLITDPYMEDVHGIKRWAFMCERHEYESVMDI